MVDAAGKAGSVETSTLNCVLQGAGLFNVLAPDAPSSLYRGPVHTWKEPTLPPSFKKSCVYIVTLFTLMSLEVSLSSMSTTESPPFSPLGQDVGSVVALFPSKHWYGIKNNPVAAKPAVTLLVVCGPLCAKAGGPPGEPDVAH
jgi:hypothetical protein